MATKRCAIFLFLSLAASLASRADDESGAYLALQIVDHAKLVHKVKTLVIDQINWNNLSFQEAVKSLAAATKRSDPEHQGINFVICRPDVPTSAITLHLKNVTVPEVLSDIRGQPSLVYSIGTFAVSLDYDNGCGLSIRSYLVSSKFFQIGPDDKPNEGTYDVKRQLAEKGIHFAPGTSAIYTPATKTLCVVNTRNEVDAIENMLNP